MRLSTPNRVSNKDFLDSAPGLCLETRATMFEVWDETLCLSTQGLATELSSFHLLGVAVGAVRRPLDVQKEGDLVQQIFRLEDCGWRTLSQYGSKNPRFRHAICGLADLKILNTASLDNEMLCNPQRSRECALDGLFPELNTWRRLRAVGSLRRQAYDRTPFTFD